MNVQRDFFFLLLICNREGIEEKITTFMRLKQMKNGSAPGCDGIIAEFLKMVWARISKLLTLSFNSASENGNVSDAQTVVSLLQTTQIIPDISFLTDHVAYASSNKTKIV